MLLAIEIVQIKFVGWQYFHGWNVLDIFNVMFFFWYAFGRLIGFIANSETTDIIIKLFLVLISFMKLMFYMRSYESYGFLISITLSTLSELVPFSVFYFTVLALITVCLYELGEEITPDLTDVYPGKGLSRFQSMYIQQYATTLLFLRVPYYNSMLKHTTLDPSISKDKHDATYLDFDKSVTVFFIWLIWFFMTFFMNIIMINFLVSIVCSSYERLKGSTQIISYK